MNLAFSVGCSQYQDPIPRLRYAGRDADRFAQLMSESCGLRDEDIMVLADTTSQAAPPTYTALLRQLSAGPSFVRRGNTVDVLFFFFSGHGYQSPQTAEDYLLLADSVPGSFDRTALSIADAVRLLLGWEPRQLVLFVDACREPLSDSRAIGDNPDLPPPDVMGLLPPGHVTFCSCSREERSYESEHLESGIFTYALTEALGDRGRCRTLNDINTYLRRRVPELSAGLGKPVQTPVARLEPAEILHLEIVSAGKRNAWRSQVPVRDELRPQARQPGRSRLPATAIGVDYGTCNSMIAYSNKGGAPQPVPDPFGNTIVPSVVNFSEDFSYTVGWPALDRENLGHGLTIRYAKRDLGSPREYDIFGRSLSPEFVTSLVLRSLRQNAAEYLQAVPRPVIGYPESFTLAQYNALAEAFELAEWVPARLVSEPSAASHIAPRVASRQDLLPESATLIVDLGGGTLDVAVLIGDVDDRVTVLEDDRVTVLEVVSTSGDGRLGGIDYDEAMLKLIERKLSAEYGPAPDNPRLHVQLRQEAERTKRALALQDSCLVLLSGPSRGSSGGDQVISINRAELAEASASLNTRIQAAIKDAITGASYYLEPSGKSGETFWVLNEVLLTGMGGRLPSLRDTITQMLPAATIIDKHDDDAVACGLAWQASVMSGNSRHVLLLDVMHRGIGIFVQPPSGKNTDDDTRLSGMDADNSQLMTLVAAGTATPTKASEKVTLSGSSASQRRLRVVEVRGNAHTPIGVVEIEASREGTRLELVVDVDADTVITLTIKNLSAGGERRITLNSRDRSLGEPIRNQRLTGTVLE